MEYKEKSTEAYMKALISAESDKLPPTDITYLTFFLNYSVFLHDIMGDKNEAIKKAKSVLHAALRETEDITENHQKDIILLCQMIKDNLSLWKNEIPDELHNI
jgi:14-3-3 protein epsilon